MMSRWWMGLKPHWAELAAHTILRIANRVTSTDLIAWLRRFQNAYVVLADRLSPDNRDQRFVMYLQGL